MDASEVARVVIALAVAVSLAVLGAHPRVSRWERRFGLTVLASSGFPFLLLGTIIVNQLIGPVLFRNAVIAAGEAAFEARENGSAAPENAFEA